MTRGRHVAGGAVICLMCSLTARAEPITLSFSGIVTQAGGSAPQRVGDLLVGSFTIDPDKLAVTEDSLGARRFDGRADLQLAFEHVGNGTIDYDLPDRGIDLVVNNDVPYDAFRRLIFTRGFEPQTPF